MRAASLVLVLLVSAIAVASADNRISGLWKFRTADTDVCVDEAAFALQAVLTGSNLKITPVPTVVMDVDNRVAVFEWAPVSGTGNEQSGFKLDGDVWRMCNTSQVGESLTLTCFVKGGLGTCSFTYMCAYGACNTSTVPPLKSEEVPLTTPEQDAELFAYYEELEALAVEEEAARAAAEARRAARAARAAARAAAPAAPATPTQKSSLSGSSSSEESDAEYYGDEEGDESWSWDDEGDEEEEDSEGMLSEDEYLDGYYGELPRRMYTWRDLPGIENFTAPMITQCEVANYLRQVGFAASLAKMVCTAFYESSWNCNAKHMNTDGSQDYGLLQINSYWWCSGGPRSRYNGCSASCDSMLQCSTNARCARTVFDQQGVTAWYAYKAHKTECDSYYLPC